MPDEPVDEVQIYRLENQAQEAVAAHDFSTAQDVLREIVTLDGVDPGPYAASIGVLGSLEAGNPEEAFYALCDAAHDATPLAQTLGRVVGEALEAEESWLLAAAAFRLGDGDDRARAEALRETHELDEIQLAAFTPDLVESGEATPETSMSPQPPAEAPAQAVVPQRSVRQAMADEYVPITDLSGSGLGASGGPSVMLLAMGVVVNLLLGIFILFAISIFDEPFWQQEVILVALVAFALITFFLVVYYLHANSQKDVPTEIMIAESCLLCDSTQVQRYTGTTGESEYRCGRCGYYSPLDSNPQTARLVVRFQDVKNALYALRDAEHALESAQSVARFGGDIEREYMDDASKYVREAHLLLISIADEYPEVLHMPATGFKYAGAAVVTMSQAIFGESDGDRIVRHEAEREAISDELGDAYVYIGVIENIATWMQQQILEAGGVDQPPTQG